jgi:hypothetical protein
LSHRPGNGIGAILAATERSDEKVLSSKRVQGTFVARARRRGVFNQTPGDAEKIVANSVQTVTHFLAESRSVYMLAAMSNGGIQFCNGALAERLKIAPAGLATQLVWDLLCEHDALSFRNRLAETPSGPPQMFLLNFVDADQCPFTLECRLEVRADGFLLLGEAPRRPNETAQKEILRLNNELSTLGRELTRRSRELDHALQDLKTSHWHLKKIQEVLPICMECGKVKTTTQWEDVVSYLKTNAMFLSHGYCPACLEKIMVQWGMSPQE